MIMAGGSGTRLWPMSRDQQPKQLIPFIGGKCLLEIAWNRLDGLVPPANCRICAGEKLRLQIMTAMPQVSDSQYLGEPTGRDTASAVGFAAAVIARQDPDAVIAVFTADHVIEPIDQFQRIVAQGYELAEKHGNALVTFGITPTQPATGYGYLELGKPLSGDARTVVRFREKPDAASARQFFDAGPAQFLWNSGMFVWRASTLLQCLARFQPEIHAGLSRIADAWQTPAQTRVLAEVYPTLKKISVDFAVMEPASRDSDFQVVAVPMPLKWLDVGSWPSFAATCAHDAGGNALGGGRQVLKDTTNTLVASSDGDHLIATIGCEDLIIIHTPRATLVCRADQAERIKELHAEVGRVHGSRYQ